MICEALKNSFFYKLSLLATILAFIVILFGSYVRLSNAGLGCPDWPGCYGKLMVPESSIAQSSHPDSDFSAPKAWKEMLHRYLAGGLALLILCMALMAPFQRRFGMPFWTPLFLLALVIFQALLGMWTVTLKLHPLVVMSHLVGGYATFLLLAWQSFSLKMSSLPSAAGFLWKPLKPYIFLGALLVLIQIVLGGWLSSNYASLACPDFPTCQGKWWPEFHFSQAFTFWHEFGPNYEWGILNNTSRVTIHMMHRLGSVVVTLYWLVFSLVLLLKPVYQGLRKSISLVLLCLIIQITLGISNIIFYLPLPVAVAHTGMAALLLLATFNLWFSIPKPLIIRS